MTTQELLFFETMPRTLALYEILSGKLLSAFPNVTVKVQKTQITFREKYGFAFGKH